LLNKCKISLRGILQNTSKNQNGGRAYFEATKRESLEEIYGKIEEELRSQHRLGHAPDLKGHGGCRRIKVDAKKKGMIVHGCEGYYAK
jgi:hypothetical protein